MFTDRILHNSAKRRWLVLFRAGENWDWGSRPLGSLCPACSRSFRPTLTTVSSWTLGGKRAVSGWVTVTSQEFPQNVQTLWKGTAGTSQGQRGQKKCRHSSWKFPGVLPRESSHPPAIETKGQKCRPRAAETPPPLPVGPPAPPAEAGSKSGPC